MDGDWTQYDQHQRGAYRTRNTVAGVTLTLGDDSGPVQLHQTVGLTGELRHQVVRLQQPGFSSMPLVGAKGLAIYHGGYRGYGNIVAVEDARYRPTGLKPGEFTLFVIDGAGADGSGGKVRPIIQGRLGGKGQLLGVEIDIGDADTTDVTIKGSGKVVVNAPRVEIGSAGGSVQPVKLADGSNSTVLFSQ